MNTTVSVLAHWFCWTQRPHHFVDFLNSIGLAADVFSVRRLRSAGPALRAPGRLTAPWVYPRPFTAFAPVRRWNEAIAHNLLDRFFASDVACQVFAAYPEYPTRRKTSAVRVYDCMDDWSGFPGIDPDIERRERAVAEWADVIWVVSRRLQEKFGNAFGDKVRYVPNGVDYDHFRIVPSLRALTPRREKPALGYIGAIESWFDVALVRGVASLLRDWRIILAGPNCLPPRDAEMLALPNVELVGRVPYQRLPELMTSMQVAMIPFKRSRLIDSTSPIKVYEYLAAGLPVVAAPMPELEPLVEDGVLTCCETPGEFADAVRRFQSGHRPERCQEIARGSSWQARFRQPFSEALGVVTNGVGSH